MNGYNKALITASVVSTHFIMWGAYKNLNFCENSKPYSEELHCDFISVS